VKARRTCVACRQVADRKDLVRLVLSPDREVVVDYYGRLPGRGAWVHCQRECVDALVRKPAAVARALKHRVDLTELGSRLRRAVARAVEDGLSQAAAGGALVGGHDALERALADGRVVELVVASDASARTVADLRRAASDEVRFTVVSATREVLGGRVGQGPRAAVGVVVAPASTHLQRQLHRLRNVG
jgi:predicted RNA-binding protein YlxR (DUF448 family)